MEQNVNRAPLFTACLIYYGQMKETKGIIFNSGSDWRELRRFTLRTLRDFGFGKKGSEGIVLEECVSMNEAIDKMIAASNGVIDVDKLFNKAAMNVVWNVTAAERFDYEDENMKELYNFLELFMLMGKKIIGKPLGIFPSLRYIPPFRSTYNQAAEGMDKCRKFIAKTIKKHRDSLDPNEPRDFIDKFLIDMKEIMMIQILLVRSIST